MSDSLQPYGFRNPMDCRQAPPGKNTKVGCHASLQDLPDPEIERMSLTSPPLAVGFFTTSVTWKAQ